MNFGVGGCSWEGLGEGGRTGKGRMGEDGVMKGVLERHVGGDGHKKMGGEESEAG